MLEFCWSRMCVNLSLLLPWNISVLPTVTCRFDMKQHASCIKITHFCCSGMRLGVAGVLVSREETTDLLF